jgi:hypothetical protein
MPGPLRIRVRYKSVISNWFDYLLVCKDELRKPEEHWLASKTPSSTATRGQGITHLSFHTLRNQAITPLSLSIYSLSRSARCCSRNLVASTKIFQAEMRRCNWLLWSRSSSSLCVIVSRVALALFLLSVSQRASASIATSRYAAFTCISPLPMSKRRPSK